MPKKPKKQPKAKKLAKGLTVVGFDLMEELLDPKKFEARLQRNVAKSMKTVGRLGADKIVEEINAGKYKSNSPITIFFKESGRPLVDSGNLTASITSKLDEWHTVMIGVLRNKVTPQKDGKGEYVFNIARWVHEGMTIKVTEKMRRWLAARIPNPLRSSTKRLRIPKRPFLRAAVSKQMYAVYRKPWMKALEDTFRGVG